MVTASLTGQEGTVKVKQLQTVRCFSRLLITGWIQTPPSTFILLQHYLLSIVTIPGTRRRLFLETAAGPIRDTQASWLRLSSGTAWTRLFSLRSGHFRLLKRQFTFSAWSLFNCSHERLIHFEINPPVVSGIGTMMCLEWKRHWSTLPWMQLVCSWIHMMRRRWFVGNLLVLTCDLSDHLGSNTTPHTHTPPPPPSHQRGHGLLVLPTFFPRVWISEKFCSTVAAVVLQQLNMQLLRDAVPRWRL